MVSMMIGMSILLIISRVKDWLYGVRAAQPDREAHSSLTKQPLYEAERYRIVYEMITNSREDGGAGITLKQEPWKHVESIFPLHDHKFNKEWMKKWSTTTFLKADDLDEIRDRLGEKVMREPLYQHLGILIPRSGGLLLRIYSIVFPIPDVSCCVWIFCLGFTWSLFSCVCDRQRAMVYRLP